MHDSVNIYQSEPDKVVAFDWAELFKACHDMQRQKQLALAIIACKITVEDMQRCKQPKHTPTCDGVYVDVSTAVLEGSSSK